ncbi:MAG: glutamine--fructose-6-phosphate transaminase (isomerizing), partial [Candidatus Hydrogenedentes bacterium]|nr:glutamine--fructose-6-phosphate transaminase (isomerizing) [Candidatus Hydrogenedentota bacterium]
NEQVAVVRKDGCEVTDLDGSKVDMPVSSVEWDIESAEKSGYPHFMLKEIHEQPDVLRRILAGRIKSGSTEVDLGDIGIAIEDLVAAPKITIIACGTAWHAALTGKYLIESFVRIPVEVDTSSEYRYRDPIVPEGMILMSVSQSGETADTLAGIREAKRRGAKVLSIVNVVGSSIARESDGVIYTHAGPEIGVASTKAYTSQITAFCLLTLMLGRAKGTITEDQAAEFIAGLNEIPEKIERMLADQTTIEDCAEMYCEAHTWLYLGRGYNFPNAFEGALKLKEVSYIHAEGYGAGEMKHGPIALVDKMMPVVCIAPADAVHEKMVSNIQEIRARRGIIIAIATEGDTDIKEHCDEVIYIPATQPYLNPLLVAIPMQLLAYHVAVRRGCDVDQPRNLAKSVTVE